MSKTTTTYEFSNFPLLWKHERRGWHRGCLSTFSFDTLKEARAEIKRLDAAITEDHKHFGREETLKEFHERHNNELNKIVRVDRTPVDD